jgi:DNA-3-methyladenine glycosylase II
MKTDLLSEETLESASPYDFTLSCGIFSRFGRGTHTSFFAGTFYKCFEEAGNSLLLTISSLGSKLRTRLFGSGSKMKPGPIASWLLSLDLDLNPFYERADSVMSRLTEELHGLKPPRTRTVFEALVIAITEQQIGLNVAQSLQNRLVERYGTRVDHEGGMFFTFPAPERLSVLDQHGLRGVGLSRNKSKFIVDISRDVATGKLDLESMKSISTEKARDVLLAINGVGQWTANYVLIRGLGRVDMVPYDDLGIRDAVGLFYKNGERATNEEAETFLSKFGSYAGLAAYYLIFASYLRAKELK